MPKGRRGAGWSRRTLWSDAAPAARRALGLAVLVLGLAAAGAAGADSDEEYDRRGPYLGAGGFFALEATSDSDGANGGGASVAAGIRLAPGVGAELEGTWVSEVADDDLGGLGFNLKLYPFDGLGASILDGRIQPYLFGSAGAVWAGADAGGRFGAGVGSEFYVSESVALNALASFVGHGGEPSDAQYGRFLLGMLYRF